MDIPKADSVIRKREYAVSDLKKIQRVFVIAERQHICFLIFSDREMCRTASFIETLRIGRI